MMRIGILGGTFDPPHRGHLALAQTVINLDQVDKVCFIPAAAPPHKDSSHITDAEHRLAMTKLLADENALYFTNSIEIMRSGKSYTIDTLRELKYLYPENTYRLIIGSDMALIFPTWRNPEQVIDLAPPLVAERPGYFLQDNIFRVEGMTENMAKKLLAGCFEFTPTPVSSTMIRCLLREKGKDFDYSDYLTPKVLNYIYKNNLYLN